ncbi:hypothetical protein PLESTB_001380500 [Pleodorina starrii]|uniref:Uncharacterized protein n=1 Tax=Pleodorina starrii TaxID=330485 RepID=A0A9W6BUU4_9CHLO|nr:hypothetical protein PLESTM_000404700 [Pleodorina starrii]GLC58614.1 hypothetical protein PLESTB_001380500 [Pleodorina starrii]GLC67479.1 hypothetical protein PLESTF_000561900 [Pleodorina starrii]
MRTQQPQQPWAAAVALNGFLLVTSVRAAAASALSDGQIAGVVLGIVGGAVLLGLLTVLVCCCLRASRRLQTGDLSWAKSGDVEATAMGQTPHQPLSGPCADDLAAAEAARRGSAAASAAVDGPNGDASVLRGACRTDASTVTGEGQSAAEYDSGGGTDMAAFPPSGGGSGGGRKPGFFRGRSAGAGGVANFFVVPKGLLRNNSGNVKDKHLQVSRSARVEPSAELEMAETFQPAATNMGPPLSKSSMLLRWLSGADEGLPAAAAAQAAAAADGGGAAGIAGGRKAAAAARGGGGRGIVAGLGTSLDRLPLLSLAAQQTGIVWSKMPQSVASSPAVSVAESSSMFMLKGTLKRSDAPEDTAASAVHGHSQTLTHAAEALAAWHGGDDRYPASMAQASVNPAAADVGASGAARSGGIVFDYVMRSFSGRTAGGGASSRAPTIGGGVILPVSTSSGGSGPDGGFGAGDAFTMGVLPDEHMLALALHRTPPHDVQDSPRAAGPHAVGGGQPWLHQVPATKLTALREADGEEEDEGEEAAPAPAPRPALPAQSFSITTGQLAPIPAAAQSPALPLSAPAQEGPGPVVNHGSVDTARPGWTHFGDGEASSFVTTAPAVGGLAPLGAPVCGPVGSSLQTAERTLPAVGAVGYPAAAAAAAPLAAAQAALPLQPHSPRADSARDRDSTSELAVGNFFGGLPDVDVAAAEAGGQRPSELPSPATAAPRGGAPWVTPQTSNLLQARVAAPSPLPLQASQSSTRTSLLSQTSLASPSLGVHYPEFPAEALAAPPWRGGGASGHASETPRGDGGGEDAAADPSAVGGPTSRSSTGGERQ